MSLHTGNFGISAVSPPRRKPESDFIQTVGTTIQSTPKLAPQPVLSAVSNSIHPSLHSGLSHKGSSLSRATHTSLSLYTPFSSSGESPSCFKASRDAFSLQRVLGFPHCLLLRLDMPQTPPQEGIRNRCPSHLSWLLLADLLQVPPILYDPYEDHIKKKNTPAHAERPVQKKPTGRHHLRNPHSTCVLVRLLSSSQTRVFVPEFAPAAECLASL